MAEGNTALKEHALAVLQAGRREISAEARSIRHELNPKRAVVRLTRNHAPTVMISAFALGMAIPWILGREKSPDDEREDVTEGKKRKKAASAPKVGLTGYLVGLAMKYAAPLLVKEGLRLWQSYGSPLPSQFQKRSAPTSAATPSSRSEPTV